MPGFNGDTGYCVKGGAYAVFLFVSFTVRHLDEERFEFLNSLLE
jgi:hypothetical protein